jgi:Protein of unknown function (DUF2950)
MQLQRQNWKMEVFRRSLALVAIAVVLVTGCTRGENKSPNAEPAGKTFATPAEAGQALKSAVQARDQQAIVQVLGTKAKTLISSGDNVTDAVSNDSFQKKYDRMNRLVAMTDGSQVLYVGADNYPFPIPLKKNAEARWYFDAAAGENEIRARRIGRNELTAIDACKTIAKAEEEFHKATGQYTSILVSAPGKQDGLFWENAGTSVSPLEASHKFAREIFATAASTRTLAFDGYSYHVTADEKTFTVFALPMHYQHSGIVTFSAGRDGVVYERDLGGQDAVSDIAPRHFDPSDGWAQAE